MAVSLRVDQVLTFGVEEEFTLADAVDRVTVPRGREVVEKMRPRLGERAQKEFYASQVEICSEPHTNAAELRADLSQARSIAAGAARAARCLLVGSGAGVLTGRPLVISENERYRRMAQRFATVVRRAESELSGCHIHLGALERSEALDLSAAMRPWLPVIQALAANSPFGGGRDRDCASWRAMHYTLWPTVGPAPVLDAPGYESVVTELVNSGQILDPQMLLWYARPSTHVPTLEIRVSDVNADLDVTILLAVLLRGLGTTLLAELRAGRPLPVVDEPSLRFAHEQAARHGMQGFGTRADGSPAPMPECLADLVRRALPGLDAAGDVDIAEHLLAVVHRRGTGAERQRRWFESRGSLADVVDALARVTWES